jgi:hypothetical protein
MANSTKADAAALAKMPFGVVTNQPSLLDDVEFDIGTSCSKVTNGKSHAYGMLDKISNLDLLQLSQPVFRSRTNGDSHGLKGKMRSLYASLSNAYFPTMLRLAAEAKVICSARLPLEFSQGFGIGHSPTCFTELHHFGCVFHGSTYKLLHAYSPIIFQLGRQCKKA